MKKQSPRPHPHEALERDKSRPAFPIVGVGASAGGLEAFTQLLKSLPVDTGLGFVLVQHLDPKHESALTQLLTRATAMPVLEVTNDQRVKPNHVYVIPPNTNLGIAKGRLKLRQRQGSRTPPHAIDVFFESLAEDLRERAIGVILSGTATDGTAGLETIKAEGGITFAQDESAKYDSMPRSAVAAGCVDFVLAPEAIAQELTRIAKHPYVLGQTTAEAISEGDQGVKTTAKGDDRPLPSHGRPHRGAEGESGTAGKDSYKKILLLLRNHSGVDFSLYRSTTIQRRITRRMVLNKHISLDDYAGFLLANAKELDALYSDVLISVTSFFRNPEAFEVLKCKVFPKLLQQRNDHPLRVWVIGCSTGQEAYSIAMAFMESLEQATRMRRLQVFATDLNDTLLDKARQGLYAKSLVQDLSPERLRRFFIEEEGGYRVIKPLREMVVFARQNLISGPPFSRMDLISCRNLMIYLDPSLQRKAILTFHYALKPEGFLFLGASESIGGFTDLFEPADKKHKIYTKKGAPTPAHHLLGKMERGEHPLTPSVKTRSGEGQASSQFSDGLQGELNVQREADRVSVIQFAPPGVLVNDELQILQFRGPTGAYLQPPSTGKATFDVLKMAREGLMLPLRAAINKAKKDNHIAHKEQVRVQQNGTTRVVNIQVIPLKNLRERCFLILFEDADKIGRISPARGGPREGPKLARAMSKKAESRRVQALESELTETRDYLQSIHEQHEVANEELQASNEEVQSANEELQSINEELETSKEELESANEELTTVNDEMADRNQELSRLNADLTNFQASTKLPMLWIGRDLTIRRFSLVAEKVFNLLAVDVGRPLSGIRHNLVEPNSAQETPTGRENGTAMPCQVEDLVREVIDSVRAQDREVRDKDGRWYTLRVHPYLTLDNKIDGAVLVLVDITDLKRGEQALARALGAVESTIETLPLPLLVIDARLRVERANRAFYRAFLVEPAETLGRFIYDLGSQQWNIARLRQLLEEILPQNTVVENFEVEHNFESLGLRTMLLNAVRNLDPVQKSERILLTIVDITERKRNEETAARFVALVESSDDAIIAEDLNGVMHSWNEGAERLFGYKAQEAIGRPVTMLMPPGREDEEALILERIRRGEILNHYEATRLRKDGSMIDVALTISPIRNAQREIVGVSKIARDITERKLAVDALAASHAELRSHVEELARFNNAAVGRELRMIELKKEINELCQQHGEPPRYPLEFEREGEATDE